jgi:hypothetical protein
MSDEEIKPLNWKPAPNIGYIVVRRPDGGMHLTITNLSLATLIHWREFSLQHLYNSDRLTRNLYDLRQVQSVSEEAIRYAIEVNNDPAARNIRLAVVVGNEAVRTAIQQIADLSITPGGVEMAIFNSIDEANDWLDRPLTKII